ncbi:MAG: hypothetical protein ABSH28_19295 [Acidobacteriota bacterium]
MNRLLTEAEQVAVGRLSSHIEVSSSRAVVTYSWGATSDTTHGKSWCGFSTRTSTWLTGVAAG